MPDIDHRGETSQVVSGSWSWLRVGLLAGLATVFASSLVVFLLGLIPSHAVQTLFLTGTGDPYTTRLARDVLSPWNGQFSWTFTTQGGARFKQVTSGVVFGDLLVLVAVLYGVGWFVRRKLPASLRLRALTLLATSLTCAVLTGLVAALDTYRQLGWREMPPLEAHDPLTYGLSALVLTLLVGAFAFGVVGLLPGSLSGALKGAALLVGVSFVVAGLLLPTCAVIDATRPDTFSAYFAYASQWSAATGGLAIPLALQAPVQLDETLGIPFLGGKSYVTPATGRPLVRWPALVYVAVGQPRGRLVHYAARLGVWGDALGAVITLAVVAGLVGITVGLCRRIRPQGTLAALRLGSLQGACVVLLLLPLAELSAFSVRVDFESRTSNIWGTPAWSLLYTAVVLTALCAVVAVGWSVFLRCAAVREKDVVHPD